MKTLLTVIALVSLTLGVGCTKTSSNDNPSSSSGASNATASTPPATPSATPPSTTPPPPTKEEPKAPPAPSDVPAPEDVKAPPSGAKKTATGLASKVLQKGTGSEHPAEWDSVTVHYTGWTTDGKMFDSSVVRGQPATFPLDRVIPGWTEGVQLMVEGEKRRLWIPQDLAYKGRPGAPAGMLVFDVELIKIVD